MNTTANTNKDLNEPLAMKEKFVFSVLRNFLPHQLDNERAADYLRTEIGKSNNIIEWSIVRPDTLIDENTVTEYRVFPSPVRSPIFDAGKTSKINVAHFLADLMTNEKVWLQWKGKMPVIYNEAFSLRK